MNVSKLIVIVLLLGMTGACTRDPKALVAAGNKYFKREKYHEAGIMYRRALQKDRKNAEAWYRLGLVDLRTGQVGDAAGALTRAAQLDPGNADASSKLADLYFAASIFDKAHRDEDLAEVKTIAADLLRRDPKSFDGQRLSGYVAIAENRLPEAVKHFENANAEKPNQPQVVLALCQTLASVNRRDEAEKMSRDLINRYKQYAAAYDFLARLYVSENKPEIAEAVLKEKVANNPKYGAYQIQLARFYLALGKTDQMHGVLKHLTSDLKTYPDAWMLVGEFYQSSNTPDHVDQALNAFTQGEKSDPAHKLDYQKRRAQALIAANRLPEADALATEILRANPNDSEAIAVRAALDIQTGQKDKVLKAIAALQPLAGKEQATRIAPMVHLNLGRAYSMKAAFDYGDADPTKRQNDLDQARIQLEQAIQSSKGRNPVAELLLADVQMQRGEYSRVAQLADDILNVEPTNVSAHMLRAKALQGMHETEKAREELTRVLAGNPKMSEARYQLAVLDFGQKNYKSAEAGFSDLWREGEDRAFVGLMETRLAEGQYASVLQDIQKQLSAHPDNLNLRIGLANAQAEAGQLKDAIANYQRVLDAAPNLKPAMKTDLLMREATVQRAAGDQNAALQTLLKARDVAPGDSSVMVQLALMYEMTGHKDQARDQYEKVLKIEPDNVTALNNLAYMKADESVDLDRAMTLAQRARQKKPDNLDIQDTLALIYLRKNLTDEGLRLMTELVDKVPNSSTFHYHLALALVQKGDNTAAKKELNTALRDKPNVIEQSKIKELIAKIG